MLLLGPRPCSLGEILSTYFESSADQVNPDDFFLETYPNTPSKHPIGNQSHERVRAYPVH